MNQEQSLIKALLELSDNKGSFSILNSANNHIQWDSTDIIRPSDEEISNKANEILNAEPLRELREERNRRIAQTDWRFRSDLSPSQEWIDYSQALRDFPENYSPTFDVVTEDDYPLVKEDNTAPWPEEPTDG